MISVVLSVTLAQKPILRIRPGRLDQCIILVVDVQSKMTMLIATRKETQCTKQRDSDILVLPIPGVLLVLLRGRLAAKHDQP